MDKTRYAYDKLCSYLTMDEISEFCDVISDEIISDFECFFGSELRKMAPCYILIWSFRWSDTKQGNSYWRGVYYRLEKENKNV